MAVTTSTETRAAAELRPQRIQENCRTWKKRAWKIGGVYLLIAVIGVAAALGAFFHFQPAALTHPDFETAAVAGAPQVDEEIRLLHAAGGRGIFRDPLRCARQ